MIELTTTLARWSYSSLPLTGTCRIDQQPIKIRLTLEGSNLRAVPDVLEVEKWARETLKAETTAEEFAVAAAEFFKMTATVKGRTKTHGTITVTV